MTPLERSQAAKRAAASRKRVALARGGFRVKHGVKHRVIVLPPLATWLPSARRKTSARLVNSGPDASPRGLPGYGVGLAQNPWTD